MRGRLRDDAGVGLRGATVCVFETVDLDDASRELVATATLTDQRTVSQPSSIPGPRAPSRSPTGSTTRCSVRHATVKSSVVPTFTAARKSLGMARPSSLAATFPDRGRAPLGRPTGTGREEVAHLQTADHRLTGALQGQVQVPEHVWGVRYRFRAVVKRQGGYPYEPGSRGRPRCWSEVRGPGTGTFEAVEPWAGFTWLARSGRARRRSRRRPTGPTTTQPLPAGCLRRLLPRLLLRSASLRPCNGPLRLPGGHLDPELLSLRTLIFFRSWAPIFVPAIAVVPPGNCDYQRQGRGHVGVAQMTSNSMHLYLPPVALPH